MRSVLPAAVLARAPWLLRASMLAILVVIGLKAAVLVGAIMPARASSAPAAEKKPTPHAAASPAPAAPSLPAPPPASAEPSPPAAPPPPSAGELALLTDLRNRRAALDAREAGLREREANIAAADARITRRIDELQALRKQLEALESARKTREEAGWQGLVKVYEQMKPREAAAIFNDLDKPVLLQLLNRMKEAKAAPILAAMQADRARFATAELARLRARENTPGGDAAAPAAPQAPQTQGKP